MNFILLINIKMPTISSGKTNGIYQYLFAGKVSCSTELRMKKVLWPQAQGLSDNDFAAELLLAYYVIRITYVCSVLVALLAVGM